MPSESPLVNI